MVEDMFLLLDTMINKEFLQFHTASSIEKLKIVNSWVELKKSRNIAGAIAKKVSTDGITK